MSEQHIEESLNKIRAFFKNASDRIEALKPGQKIPATELAGLVGKDFGLTGPQIYPVLIYLIKGYPGVLVKKGAHGGIEKLAIKPIANDAVQVNVPELETE